jgi:hypothetical protein
VFTRVKVFTCVKMPKGFLRYSYDMGLIEKETPGFIRWLLESKHKDDKL